MRCIFWQRFWIFIQKIMLTNIQQVFIIDYQNSKELDIDLYILCQVEKKSEMEQQKIEEKSLQEEAEKLDATANRLEAKDVGEKTPEETDEKVFEGQEVFYKKFFEIVQNAKNHHRQDVNKEKKEVNDQNNENLQEQKLREDKFVQLYKEIQQSNEEKFGIIRKIVDSNEQQKDELFRVSLSEVDTFLTMENGNQILIDRKLINSFWSVLLIGVDFFDQKALFLVFYPALIKLVNTAQNAEENLEGRTFKINDRLCFINKQDVLSKSEAAQEVMQELAILILMYCALTESDCQVFHQSQIYIENWFTFQCQGEIKIQKVLKNQLIPLQMFKQCININFLRQRYCLHDKDPFLVTMEENEEKNITSKDDLLSFNICLDESIQSVKMRECLTLFNPIMKLKGNVFYEKTKVALPRLSDIGADYADQVLLAMDSILFPEDADLKESQAWIKSRLPIVISGTVLEYLASIKQDDLLTTQIEALNDHLAAQKEKLGDEGSVSEKTLEFLKLLFLRLGRSFDPLQNYQKALNDTLKTLTQEKCQELKQLRYAAYNHANMAGLVLKFMEPGSEYIEQNFSSDFLLELQQRKEDLAQFQKVCYYATCLMYWDGCDLDSHNSQTELEKEVAESSNDQVKEFYQKLKSKVKRFSTKKSFLDYLYVQILNAEHFYTILEELHFSRYQIDLKSIDAPGAYENLKQIEFLADTDFLKLVCDSDDMYRDMVIRTKKIKIFEILISSRAATQAQIPVQIQHLVASLNSLFGNNCDEAHEILMFYTNKFQVWEFLEVPGKSYYSDLLTTHFKTFFGDTNQIDNLDAQLYYSQKQIRYFAAKHEYAKANAEIPTCIGLLKKRIEILKAENKSSEWDKLRLLLCLQDRAFLKFNMHALDDAILHLQESEAMLRNLRPSSQQKEQQQEEDQTEDNHKISPELLLAINERNKKLAKKAIRERELRKKQEDWDSINDLKINQKPPVGKMQGVILMLGSLAAGFFATRHILNQTI